MEDPLLDHLTHSNCATASKLWIKSIMARVCIAHLSGRSQVLRLNKRTDLMPSMRRSPQNYMGPLGMLPSFMISSFTSWIFSVMFEISEWAVGM